MKFRYSLAASPPDLICPVVVSSLSSTSVIDVDAKIDTAADITTLPVRICEELKLSPADHVPCRGARGEVWASVTIFLVRIRFAGSEWIQLVVAESPRDYMLLGRDILNQCILHADGPAGFFELTLPIKKS